VVPVSLCALVHQVSIWAKEYIESNLNRPAFNIASINPQLYGEVPALNQALVHHAPVCPSVAAAIARGVCPERADSLLAIGLVRCVIRLSESP
jgi:hypothetical protein